MRQEEETMWFRGKNVINQMSLSQSSTCLFTRMPDNALYLKTFWNNSLCFRRSAFDDADDVIQSRPNPIKPNIDLRNKAPDLHSGELPARNNHVRQRQQLEQSPRCRNSSTLPQKGMPKSHQVKINQSYIFPKRCYRLWVFVFFLRIRWRTSCHTHKKN